LVSLYSDGPHTSLQRLTRLPPVATVSSVSCQVLPFVLLTVYAGARRDRRATCRRSLAGETTIDWQRHPGDHGGAVAEQENDRSSNLVLGRPAAERHRAQEGTPDFLAPPVPGRHRGHDYGGVYAVDADVVFAELQRGNARDAVE